MPTEETKDQKIYLIVDKNGDYHEITQITNLNPAYIVLNSEHAVPLDEFITSLYDTSENFECDAEFEYKPRLKDMIKLFGFFKGLKIWIGWRF